MRLLLTFACLLVAAGAAQAGQQSPGDDRNNDGGPGDRRNAWELQRNYDANGMPRSWGYGGAPTRPPGQPWPWTGDRFDPRRGYYGIDPRAPAPYYRCDRGPNGLLTCQRAD